jgi:hypothetical protein
MTAPFRYPDAPHTRRHGPLGYASYASYRPWLRDEFSFRCVFCLHRERWVPGGFHLDHFLPVATHPALATQYDNLIFCCSTCNTAKHDLEVPDPSTTFLEGSVRVLEDGSIEGVTPEAGRIIRLLGLNSAAYREYRRLWIGIVALAAKWDPGLCRQVLGYPEDLPDLRQLRPPGGNGRPGGLADCHFVWRLNGNLPETY